MLTRVVAVPATALVVLVVGPGLVVKTLNPAKGGTVVSVRPQAPPPSAVPASLTIAVSDDDGKTHPLRLNILTTGAPPTTTATLVDDSGTGTATVGAGSHCPRTPVHNTGTPHPRPWCLVVSGLSSGHQVSGEIVSAKKGGTALKLTVSRRRPLFWWPAVILVAGLLTPFVTGWLMDLLRRVAGLFPSARAIRRNARSASRVSGLRGWAEDQVASGTAPGDVDANVKRIVSLAAQIRSTRLTLAKAIADAKFDPPLPPYVEQARSEAHRRTITMDDVLASDGSVKATPDAAVDLPNVQQLAADAKLIGDLEKELGDVVPESRDAARLAVEQAKAAFGLVTTAGDIAALRTPIANAQAVVRAGLPREAQATHTKAIAGHAEAVGAAQPDVTSLLSAVESGVVSDVRDALERIRKWSPITSTPRRLWLEEMGAGALTIGALGIALTFAALNTLQSAYWSNPLFNSTGDMFTLYGAALTSGVAATVLTIVDYWRPQPSA